MTPPSWLPPIPDDHYEIEPYNTVWNFTFIKQAGLLKYFDMIYTDYVVTGNNNGSGITRFNFITRFPPKQFEILLSQLKEMKKQDTQDQQQKVTRLYY